MVRKIVITCSIFTRFLEFTSSERQFSSVILHVPVKERLASEVECCDWPGHSLPSHMSISEIRALWELDSSVTDYCYERGVMLSEKGVLDVLRL